MSTDVVKFAFIAGEISPTLYGRSDLTKFDLGMARAYNYFVDYRGGLSTRPGFEFGDWIKADDKVVRFIPFAFSPDLEDTYGVLFGDNYIRWVQDNGYVLEDAIAISGITSSVLNVVAHGLVSGRWVKLSGLTGANSVHNSRSFQVVVTDANHFSLLYVPSGDVVVFTNQGAVGSSRAIYEIVSPYAAEDLAGLNFFQRRDLLRLTHLSYPITNLIRNDHTDWELEEEEIGDTGVGPTITADSPSTAGSAQALFAITSIYEDGTESVRGPIYLADLMVNYTTEEGSVQIVWGADPLAVEYNVYRSIVSAASDLDSGSQLGFLGKVTGTTFVDSNIIPDFTKAPPTIYDPFEPGAITKITVTAPGTGFPLIGSTVTITDPDGSGFVGAAVSSVAGGIVNVTVLKPGKGYTAPVVSFASGTGATATAEMLPASGVYPSLSCVFQQRQIYAASETQPVTIWGSQPKIYANFNSNAIVLDSDSFEFDLDSNSVAAIRHMLTTRGGLLLMTQENVWLLNGGSAGAPLTPTNALADPQTFNGVSTLDPLMVGSDILYTEGKGFAVRMLTYNEISRVYSGIDRSILANHLFGPGKAITAWAYQESPFKVVWGIKEDGYLVSFTTVQEQDVYAWTPGATKGRFKDIVGLREGTRDRVYAVVERLIEGRFTKMFERMALREFTRAEEAWCVDSGLSNTPNYQNQIINLDPSCAEEQGTVATVSCPDGNFTGFEGWIIRAAGGRFKVTEGVNTEATVLVLDPATDTIPEDEAHRIYPQPALSWSLDLPQTTFSGLWHLEGEEVAVLGDGNVFPRQTVLDGSVTLPNAVTRVIIGLPFRCIGQTLPMIVGGADIEGRRKRVPEVAVRLDASRGLKVGRTLDEHDLYPLRERTTEPYGQPIKLINGIKHAMISTNWDDEGQTFFVQDDPLPITLLGLVSSIEVGDDPD